MAADEEMLEKVEKVEVEKTGHPTDGVFMKCWRCQKTHRLAYDGNGSLHCPICWEALILL